MCKEVYANFELAKLLYEKGFDWESNPFEGWQDRDAWVQQYFIEKPNPHYDPDLPFSCATITDVLPHVSLAVVMKWLREIYKLEVRSTYDYDKDSWWGNITPMFVETDENSDIYQKALRFDYQGKSYEQACEAAIKYCLENLV